MEENLTGLLSTFQRANSFSILQVAATSCVSQIIKLLEGSTCFVECVDNPKLCSRADTCVTRDIWDEVNKAMNGVLESTTLQNLVERQKNKKPLKEAMYYI